MQGAREFGKQMARAGVARSAGQQWRPEGRNADADSGNRVITSGALFNKTVRELLANPNPEFVTAADDDTSVNGAILSETEAGPPWDFESLSILVWGRTSLMYRQRVPIIAAGTRSVQRQED